MAELILFRGRQFRSGHAAIAEFENRVVAEATVAARRIDNAAFPTRLADERRRITRRSHENQRALIASGAWRGRHRLQCREQLAQIRFITRALTGVARRVNSW